MFWSSSFVIIGLLFSLRLLMLFLLIPFILFYFSNRGRTVWWWRMGGAAATWTRRCGGGGKGARGQQRSDRRLFLAWGNRGLSSGLCFFGVGIVLEGERPSASKKWWTKTAKSLAKNATFPFIRLITHFRKFPRWIILWND